MRLPIPRAGHWPVLAAGVFALLAGGVALSAAPMDEWLLASNTARNDAPAQSAESEAPAAQETTRRKPRCSHCGVVESTRALDSGASPALYEVTVRLADKTRHVFSNTDASKWRPGARVILIGGGLPPER
jgi:hypothetical protein